MKIRFRPGNKGCLRKQINPSWLCVSPINKSFSPCQKELLAGPYISRCSKTDQVLPWAAPLLRNIRYLQLSLRQCQTWHWGFVAVCRLWGQREEEEEEDLHFPLAVRECSCAMEMQVMGTPWELHPPLLQLHLSACTKLLFFFPPGFNDFKALVNLTNSRRWTSMVNL